MKKTFNFGKIDYYGRGRKENLVTVTMEYRETDDGKKRFAVSGDVWNRTHTDILCGGQCLEEIAKHIKNPVFREILRLWRLYHLNDMHPECEHQAAAGWRETAQKAVMLYHWRLTPDALREQKAAERAALDALKNGETFTPGGDQVFFAALPYSLTTHSAELPEETAKYYTAKKPLYNGDTGHTEKKLLGWLRETEHPEGILCKPCPVCGYKYGNAWKYFPIPEQDEKIIYDLLKNGGTEQ